MPADELKTDCAANGISWATANRIKKEAGLSLSKKRKAGFGDYRNVLHEYLDRDDYLDIVDILDILAKFKNIKVIKNIIISTLSRLGNAEKWTARSVKNVAGYFTTCANYRTCGVMAWRWLGNARGVGMPRCGVGIYLEVYEAPDRITVNQGEAVKIALAVLVRTLRDAAATHPARAKDRRAAVNWLSDGTAAEWLAAIGARVRQV